MRKPCLCLLDRVKFASTHPSIIYTVPAYHMQSRRGGWSLSQHIVGERWGQQPFTVRVNIEPSIKSRILHISNLMIHYSTRNRCISTIEQFTYQIKTVKMHHKESFSLPLLPSAYSRGNIRFL